MLICFSDVYAVDSSQDVQTQRLIGSHQIYLDEHPVNKSFPITLHVIPHSNTSNITLKYSYIALPGISWDSINYGCPTETGTKLYEIHERLRLQK